MATEARMGGQPVTRIVLMPSSDIVNSLMSNKLGSVPSPGLATLVEEKYDGRFEVELEMGSSERLADFGSADADVLILSASPSLRDSIPVDSFVDELTELITLTRATSNPHVIVYNCSSVDPADNVHNYFSLDDTFSLQAHRYNLALIRLSMAHGISIIDAERVVAQLGGAGNVSSPLSYSHSVYLKIRDTVLEVLEDIGFFEERPLIAQLGSED